MLLLRRAIGWGSDPDHRAFGAEIVRALHSERIRYPARAVDNKSILVPSRREGDRYRPYARRSRTSQFGASPCPLIKIADEFHARRMRVDENEAHDLDGVASGC